ncbi:MAG: NifU family protein [Fibromonadales bacterium]|nr:NifU family protein [Fibromonadales bacterium]
MEVSLNIEQLARFPKRRGAIFQVEADNKGLALVDVKCGTLKIYVLIDPDTDLILDTKFFTYGGPLLTALADILCEGLVGKKIGDVQSLLQDFQAVANLPAMVTEAYPEKKNVAFAARAAMGSEKLKACTVEGREEADAEWNALGESEKLDKIEECMNEYVRAMLAGDGGGLEVLGIKGGKTVMIRYHGACAGCGAASGGTLVYIEDQLQQHVYYGLIVEPEIQTLEIGDFYAH